ncbi:MAG: ferritin-like domain-containing protein [Candidatus Niameybacter stercoravium]|nr:ferritin-like domain-containing protein [Candidatus Niameybacter stercoravium]
MALTQKEDSLIKDLQDQEKLCIDKYNYYAEAAKDQELKNLFNRLKTNEQDHFNALSQILNNETSSVNYERLNASQYSPKTTYDNTCNAADKEHDKFLCTDCIATEKYVSSAYNNDLFQFASTNVREVLNHIQTDEQNHAEMIYKYKSMNGMS